MKLLPNNRRSRAGRLNEEGGRRFLSLVQNVSDIIMVFGDDGRLRHISPSIERLLGYAPDIILRATNPWFMVHSADLRRVEQYLADAFRSSGGLTSAELRMQHTDGSYRYLEALATNLMDDRSVQGVVVTLRDITQRKDMEEQLARHAFFDGVTGLANRTLFMNRISEALSPGRTDAVAVLFLDLDGFKLINDSMGHEAGDRLLALAGQRLGSCLRPGDLVARFGGDEFTILMERVPHPALAMRIAERIVKEFKSAFSLDGRDVYAGVSVGVAVSTAGEHRRPDDLVREADTALYVAKSRGKGQAVLFHPSMNNHVVGRLDLETDLRRALERNELTLHYQPSVDLRSGHITGVEALVRWQHPVRGLVAPNNFIPLAEETGLILPIGHWVLEEACQQARVWQAMRGDHSPLTISVNLSPRQFYNADLAADIERAIHRAGLRPAQLKLEITETTLMSQSANVDRVLDQFRRIGLQLALDDFGTGYSSLSYLRAIKAHTLKVDRSFVADLQPDLDGGGQAVAIIKAVTDLAHALGMHVTIEGVETSDQLATLRAIHADEGQGFLFSKPLPTEAVTDLLRSPASLLKKAS